jgi:hypothetical protein
MRTRSTFFIFMPLLLRQSHAVVASTVKVALGRRRVMRGR